MTTTVSDLDFSPTVDVRCPTRFAHTVQELLHAVALADHGTDDPVYLPENFLTNW